MMDPQFFFKFIPLLMSTYLFSFFTNETECKAPRFGLLFLWAACPEKQLPALRMYFQSDGTK